ncbi:hypothetical protein DFH08DRAFT_804056 [Mycena albidolilacea]|uniref:Uncharacterized protein n=1 Tax=Mycena albidolilacea TaxID=1033008 RepID=A0AAD7AB65_9AGAR|nr:hypothetical protein DFH08DRAFT_804056 [Mycena albidolilacea]
MAIPSIQHANCGISLAGDQMITPLASQAGCQPRSAHQFRDEQLDQQSPSDLWPENSILDYKCFCQKKLQDLRMYTPNPHYVPPSARLSLPSRPRTALTRLHGPRQTESSRRRNVVPVQNTQFPEHIWGYSLTETSKIVHIAISGFGSDHRVPVMAIPKQAARLHQTPRCGHVSASPAVHIMTHGPPLAQQYLYGSKKCTTKADRAAKTACARAAKDAAGPSISAMDVDDDKENTRNPFLDQISHLKTALAISEQERERQMGLKRKLYDKQRYWEKDAKKKHPKLKEAQETVRDQEKTIRPRGTRDSK